MKKTFSQSVEQGHAARKWRIVDATGVPVGRLASKVATLLRGKDKPEFTPHVDGGDFVVVVNAEKVVFTGGKAKKKMYYHHSGYIGGIKSELASTLLQRMPERVIRNAVEGMLPSGILGHRIATKLKVYRGAKHPHSAQKPESVNF
jgi:large subunit ribosomal protein L13